MRLAFLNFLLVAYWTTYFLAPATLFQEAVNCLFPGTTTSVGRFAAAARGAVCTVAASGWEAGVAAAGAAEAAGAATASIAAATIVAITERKRARTSMR